MPEKAGDRSALGFDRNNLFGHVALEAVRARVWAIAAASQTAESIGVIGAAGERYRPVGHSAVPASECSTGFKHSRPVP